MTHDVVGTGIWFVQGTERKAEQLMHGELVAWGSCGH